MPLKPHKNTQDQLLPLAIVFIIKDTCSGIRLPIPAISHWEINVCKFYHKTHQKRLGYHKLSAGLHRIISRVGYSENGKLVHVSSQIKKECRKNSRPSFFKINPCISFNAVRECNFIVNI